MLKSELSEEQRKKIRAKYHSELTLEIKKKIAEKSYPRHIMPLMNSYLKELESSKHAAWIEHKSH